jgi:hypothetical protein
MQTYTVTVRLTQDQLWDLSWAFAVLLASTYRLTDPALREDRAALRRAQRALSLAIENEAPDETITS